MMVFSFIKKFFKAIYLIPYGIKVGVANSKSGNLLADGNYQQALDKIAWLDNKKLRGCIGLRKANAYYWLEQHQDAIDIAQQLIPYFEKTKYYNEHDRNYLLFCAKIKVFRNYEKLNIEQPELLDDITQLSETLNLSKTNKRLMNDFPERSLKGWYKHNPKDKYYAETIAKYGEE